MNKIEKQERKQFNVYVPEFCLYFADKYNSLLAAITAAQNTGKQCFIYKGEILLAIVEKDNNPVYLVKKI